MDHDPEPYFINVYRVPNADTPWIGGKSRTREEASEIAGVIKPIYRLRVVEKPKPGKLHILEKPPADWDVVTNDRAMVRAAIIVAGCMLAGLLFVYLIRNLI